MTIWQGMVTTDLIALTGTVALLWFIALWPVLYPLFIAVRAGKATPRRWWFVLSATCVSYGFFLLVTAVVWLPIELLAAEVSPELAVSSPDTATWFNPILTAAYDWFTYGVYVTSMAFAYFSTRWLWRRWPKIVERA